MSQIPIPTSSEAVIDQQTGHMRPSWRTFFEVLRKRFATAEADIAALPGTTQKVMLPLVIEVPEDKDYPLIVNSEFAITWTKVTTKSTAGTCTATVKIGSTALGGTANSVSATQETQEHSSANEMGAGGDLVLTISGNSGCEGLSINIAGTMVLNT